jgi:hypothetical protein
VSEGRTVGFTAVATAASDVALSRVGNAVDDINAKLECAAVVRIALSRSRLFCGRFGPANVVEAFRLPGDSDEVR